MDFFDEPGASLVDERRELFLQKPSILKDSGTLKKLRRKLGKKMNL